MLQRKRLGAGGSCLDLLQKFALIIANDVSVANDSCGLRNGAEG